MPPPRAALADLLRREFQKTDADSRKLKAVLMVAEGATYSEAGREIGESPRVVAGWYRSVDQHGLAGLAEKCPGRPRRLNAEQTDEIRNILKKTPADAGLLGNRWNATLLTQWIERQYGIRLSARSCRRLLAAQ